jgi:hypothetical protein
VAELAAQVGSLEERVTSALGRLERRIVTLEARADGQADAGASSFLERRGGDAVTLPPYAPEHGSRGGDAVISQTVSPGLARGGDPGGAGGARIPVELSGTEVLVTQSIPPEAWLVPQGGGRATVWLNAEVPHNRFALDRLAAFFALGERREGAYTTRVPAEVRWDDVEQRGVLRTPGTAVAR